MRHNVLLDSKPSHSHLMEMALTLLCTRCTVIILYIWKELMEIHTCTNKTFPIKTCSSKVEKHLQMHCCKIPHVIRSFAGLNDASQDAKQAYKKNQKCKMSESNLTYKSTKRIWNHYLENKRSSQDIKITNPTIWNDILSLHDRS